MQLKRFRRTVLGVFVSILLFSLVAVRPISQLRATHHAHLPGHCTACENLESFSKIWATEQGHWYPTGTEFLGTLFLVFFIKALLELPRQERPLSPVELGVRMNN
ncbi:MAG: hypothetical protein Q4P72_02060 [Eubacteriales bacterium]|nr:hypothetical protein [Eubacteriales bacterium]